jgi:hypothetical protein
LITLVEHLLGVEHLIVDPYHSHSCGASNEQNVSNETWLSAQTVDASVVGKENSSGFYFCFTLNGGSPLMDLGGCTSIALIYALLLKTGR